MAMAGGVFLWAAATASTVLCRAPLEVPHPKRPFLVPVQTEQNWLLGRTSVAAAPFGQNAEYQYSVPRRFARSSEVDRNALLLSARPAAGELGSAFVPRRAHFDDAPSLLLSTLSAPAVAAPFVQTAEYSYSLPRRLARAGDVDRDWLLAVAPTVPAVPGVQSETLVARAARVQHADDYPNLLASTLAPPPAATGVVSGSAPASLPVPRKARADDSPNLLLSTLSIPAGPLPFYATAEYTYPPPHRLPRAIEVERDWLLAVAPTIPAVPATRQEFNAVRRVSVARADDAPNLLTSTLAGAPPAAKPFVQATDYFTAPPRRLSRAQDDSLDWLTIETPPPIVVADVDSPRAPRARPTEIAPNLLLSTLSGQPAARPFVQAFEYSGPPRRPIRAIEVDRDWLLAVAPTVPAVPLVAPDVPYTRAARAQRFDLWPNLQLTTFSITPQSASYQPLDLPPARKALTQRFDDYPNLLLTTFSILPQSQSVPPFELVSARRVRATRADDGVNLLLTTLSVVTQAAPFTPLLESGAARKARGRTLDEPNLLLGTFSIVPSTAYVRGEVIPVDPDDRRIVPLDRDDRRIVPSAPRRT